MVRSLRRNRKRRKRFWLAVFILLVLVGASSYILARQSHPAKTATVEGLSIPAKAGENYLQLYENNAWRDFPLKGVNMGIAKPGHFPGETAITKEEYLRWLKYIGAMNANVIRIYTLHPPAFYEALSEYNSKAKHPLYLLHGVWIDEEKLDASADAYTESVTSEYIKEIHRAVDVIHGKADLPERPGHASGKYRTDISKYMLGWVLGIEWNPETVASTNKKHQGMPDFNGAYFQTEQASPFEAWLASTMNEVVAYETDRYRWQRPVSFTNWVTTDLLQHPSEPSTNEDMVSVNPNVIKGTQQFKAGFFASYHVYPYYPDFLNFETKYTDYVDFRGEKNSYAGYLHDLKQAHHMPVVIAEFGVPGSRGMTHRNVQGWNQGFHSEQEQGNIDAHLFEDISKEGMAGGLVFTWQDEWFKRTWNTMDLDNPDRRPFWSNTQVGEQQFGLLSFDPGPEQTALYPDGESSDWTKAKIPSVPMNLAAPVRALDDYDPQRQIRQFFMASDEKYVYFRIDFGKDDRPFDWSKTGAMILLDTIPDQGQLRIPGGSGLTTDAGIDFVIDLKGPKESRIWVDSYYDPFYYEYGPMLKLMPQVEYAKIKNNGIFHKLKLALNRPLEVPNVRGQTLHLPLDAYETGLLRFGNGNPESQQFDSLTDVSYNEQEHMAEIRIPWQLLNVKDPSTREIMGDLWKKGLQSSEKTSGFKIALLSYRPDIRSGSDTPGSTEISYAFPALANGTLPAKDMFNYQWDMWDMPQYHERLKKSYYILKDLFQKQ